MKKYKLTEETINVYGITLYQIEALISFGNIYSGEKGGFIEKEDNLNQNDDAWVSDDAWVFGHAEVFGDAEVFGHAEVSGHAEVYGNAILRNKGHKNSKTYITIGPVGSNRFITYEKESKVINAGCFSGGIDKFEKAVREKYGEESDYYPVIKFIKTL